MKFQTNVHLPGPPRRDPRLNPAQGGRTTAAVSEPGAETNLRAFTLIEMIGVLAITAILVSAGLSVGLAYLNQQVREQERAALEEFAEALRLSAIRELVIPDPSGYASQIGKYCGRSPSAVLVNPRGNTRLLLIDPGVTNCGFDLPFRQTNAPMTGGGTGVLSNLRMILVSSVGQPLPDSLPAAPGGKPSAAVFSNMWATAKGSLPAGLSWDGDPYDLCIQRVQFMDLFHPVSLNHAETAGMFTNGQIRLPGMNAFAAPWGAPAPNLRWFLQGTTLVLSNAADASILSEVIQEPLTFTYEKGRWIRGTDSLVSGTGFRTGITGADFEEAVRQFLATSVPSSGGGGKKATSAPGSDTSAAAVVNAMSNYIRLGAMGSGQKANMASPLNDLSAALLDYTGLPPGQLNKP